MDKQRAAGLKCAEPYGATCPCPDTDIARDAAFDAAHPALQRQENAPLVGKAAQAKLAATSANKAEGGSLNEEQVANLLSVRASQNLTEFAGRTVVLLVADYNFRWLLVNALVSSEGSPLSSKCNRATLVAAKDSIVRNHLSRLSLLFL